MRVLEKAVVPVGKVFPGWNPVGKLRQALVKAFALQLTAVPPSFVCWLLLYSLALLSGFCKRLGFGFKVKIFFVTSNCFPQFSKAYLKILPWKCIDYSLHRLNVTSVGFAFSPLGWVQAYL